MGKRLWLWLFLVVCFASLVLSAQDRSGERPYLVRLNSGMATLWSYQDASHDYVSIWKSKPSLMEDDRTSPLPSDGSIVLKQPSPPLIADINGDMLNELIVIDSFGITVLGTKPTYLSFPTVTSDPTLTSPQVVVSDIDGDGVSEVVTQRILDTRRRVIEAWKVEAGTLSQLWAKELDGATTWTLLLADADNDGKQELITAANSIIIMKEDASRKWVTADELQNIGTVIDVVRVGDVDGDGKNEILATGNGGMVTVYKYRDSRDDSSGGYYVMWQSGWLLDKDLRPSSPTAPASLTQGLGVADINGDNKQEILVGTSEFGILKDGSRKSAGHVHIFSFDGARGFIQSWTSEWTTAASIPAFAAGDLDGDGLNEFVYNGNEIYGYNKAVGQYTLEKKLPAPIISPNLGARIRQTAIGILPSLREPDDALRVIPVAWTLPRGRMALGDTSEVSISLGSVWAAAKDVVMEVKSDSPNLIVKNGTVRIGDIPGGQIVASPTFTVEAPKTAAQPVKESSVPLSFGNLILTITAAGGYRQTIPLRVTIAVK